MVSSSRAAKFMSAVTFLYNASLSFHKKKPAPMILIGTD